MPVPFLSRFSPGLCNGGLFVADVKTYRLGEFSLRPDTYSLLHGGSPAPMSRKRFDVLLYLVEERHRAVTRQELVEKFWDGHEVYEENVTKCISELRKVLDDQQKPHRLIETIPTLGYRYIGTVEEEAEADGDRELVVRVEPDPSMSRPSGTVLADSPADARSGATPAAVRSGGSRTLRAAMTLVFAVAVLSTTAAIVVPDGVRSLVSEDRSGSARTLAILPFKPLGEKTRDEFLELGMADALITKLSNVRQVIVLPTASVRMYTSLTQDPIAAGNELKVDTVLDGSVQRVDQRIRVTVRLIDVKEGAFLWGETFDDDFTDIFSVQDSISQRVVSALAVRLSTPEKERLAKRYTESSEAYQLYQMGRYFWNKRTPDGRSKSIDFLQQAVKRDPNYALAYAGLADSYIAATNFSAREEVHPKAKEAALKALAIDPHLAEAHAALAFSTMLFDWNWEHSEPDFLRAIELSPNYGQAHQWYAVSLISAGRFAEAMGEAEKALAVDPLSLPINSGIGWIFYLVRNYDRTIEECTRTIEMDPSFGPAYVYRGMAYEQKGMLEEAVADLEMARSLQDRPGILGALGHAYAVAGEKAKARALLRELKDSSPEGRFPPYYLALIHVGLGEADDALQLLDRAYRERYPWLIHLTAEPRWDPLRGDPRFKELVGSVGLNAH